jgi:DNA-binding CsgD family transcriptional regulator
MDHGMVLVKHQEGYLETCCFSGLLKKQPLYNLFVNEKGLFCSFMDHFTGQLDRPLLQLLTQGVTMSEIKAVYGKPVSNKHSLIKDRASVAIACGWKNLLSLSKREKECLTFLKQGCTYQMIGIKLKLSERTVEHYLDSVKNKLGLETRAELFQAAEKLIQLGL